MFINMTWIVQMALLILFGSGCISLSAITCYQCSTHENPTCADPFDDVTNSAGKVTYGCKHCSKVTTKEDHIIRDCVISAEVYGRLETAVPFCTKRSSELICLCEGDLCNGSNSLQNSHGALLVWYILLNILRVW